MRVYMPSTLARPRRAKRDSEGMVAAFTPKKGTKTESLRPKSMSGKRYSSPPLRRLEMMGLTPSARLSMRTSPKRWRPDMNHSSTAGSGWVEKIEVKGRVVCSGSARPPASML